MRFARGGHPGDDYSQQAKRMCHAYYTSWDDSQSSENRALDGMQGWRGTGAHGRAAGERNPASSRLAASQAPAQASCRLQNGVSTSAITAGRR